jgi:hypothetical protein
MTDLDLAFNPKQLRDKIGRWTIGGKKHIKPVSGDPKIARDQAHEKRDRALLARSAVEKAAARRRALADFSNEADLAMLTAPGARPKRGVNRLSGVAKPQRQVARKQIAGIQRQMGGKATGRLDGKTLAAVKKRASLPGHYRAKAVLAAQNGNSQRAANMTRKSQAVAAARKASTPAWTRHTPNPVQQHKQAQALQAHKNTGRTSVSKSFTPKRSKAQAASRKIRKP